MSQQYDYTEASIDTVALTTEIEADQSITTDLESVWHEDTGTDGLHITMAGALTGAEETALDAVVSEHTPPGAPPPVALMTDGVVMSLSNPDVALMRYAQGIAELTDNLSNSVDLMLKDKVYFGGKTDGDALHATTAGRFSLSANGNIGQGFLYVGGTRCGWSTLYDSAFQVVTSYNGSTYITVGAAATNAPPFHILMPSNSAMLWHDATTTNGTFGSNTPVLGMIRDHGSVGRVSAGTSGIGALLMALDLEANTAESGAPNVLADIESGKVLTNEGASAENHQTLPAAKAGLWHPIACQNTNGVLFKAAAGDTIRIGASVSPAGGNISTATKGDTGILIAINNTEWFFWGPPMNWVVST